MSSKTAQIGQLFWRIVEIRKKVKTSEKVIKAATDPLQKYFRVAGSKGAIAKVADSDLQKVLKVSLSCQDFINEFKAKGIGKWKDASWLIEHLTEGGARAKQKNQQGITTLQSLKINLNATRDLTIACDGMADAVMALLHIDIKGLAGKITSLRVANPMVSNDIKTINKATRNNIVNFQPNVDQAISYLRRM